MTSPSIATYVPSTGPTRFGIGVASPRLSWIVEYRRRPGSRSARTRSSPIDPDDGDAQAVEHASSRTTRCSSPGRSTHCARAARRRVASVSPATTASSHRLERPARHRGRRCSIPPTGRRCRSRPTFAGYGRRTTRSGSAGTFTVAPRLIAGPAVRLGARRLHRRAATARRSATTSSLPAGRATATDSATRPTTSPTLLARGRQRARRHRRRGLVPRPARLPRRAPRHLRRRHRSDRPARAALRRTARSDTVVDRSAAGAPRSTRALAASLYDGETYDARLADAGWSTPGFDDTGWAAVDELASVADRDGRADRTAGAPHRDAPRRWSIDQSPSGDTIVDFGQNISGRVRIRVRGQAGRRGHAAPRRGARTRRARHAAAAHGRGHRHATCSPAADAEIYEPAFTIHGFRYAEVDGWPASARRRRDRSRRLPLRHGAAPATFDCSDDAAQPAPRERALEHARQLRRRAHRLPAARRAPRLDRRHPGVRPDRRVPVRLLRPARRRGWPTSPPSRTSSAPCPPTCRGSSCCSPATPAAAWGDAAVVVPWVLYERFGDVDVLRRAVRQHAGVGRPDRHARRRRPRVGRRASSSATGSTRPPRRDEPGAARTDAAPRRHRLPRPHRRLLARAAGVLGHDADAARYDELADRGHGAASTPSSSPPTGRLASDAQTAYALALQFDLLRDRSAAQPRRGPPRRARAPRATTASAPASSARRWSATHSVDAGFVDDAYHLLLQTRMPVVAVPGDDGRDDRLGALGQHAARRLDQPRRDDLVQPLRPRAPSPTSCTASWPAWLPPSPATARCSSARARAAGSPMRRPTLRTPYGDAGVRWTRPGDRLVVDVVVPVGSTAGSSCPTAAAVEVGPGAHQFDVAHRPAAARPATAAHQSRATARRARRRPTTSTDRGSDR